VVNVNVEISPEAREAAALLAPGAPYALKVLAGRLAEDPDLGQPSGLPGILTATVAGDLFGDCPALAIGYVREPDRIEIRYVSAAPEAPSAAAADDRPEGHGHREEALPGPAGPAGGTVEEREVIDAWERITDWLRHSAPRSLRTLRAGASPAEIARLEEALGVRIPASLRALWSLTSGDDGVEGKGFLPGNEALMPLDAVVAFHRQRMEAQAREDALNARLAEEDRFTVWRAGWIPVVSFGASDRASGLYLDADTGVLGRWSRYNEGPGDEVDTLVTYLEETADMLQAPALAVRDRPGLIGQTLVWGSRLDAAQEAHWRPLTA
jgi:cell wall assembly regulator SMI1